MIMEERKGTLLKAAFAWEDLKLNSDGMVCVVVQDDKRCPDGCLYEPGSL